MIHPGDHCSKQGEQVFLSLPEAMSGHGSSSSSING